MFLFSTVAFSGNSKYVAGKTNLSTIYLLVNWFFRAQRATRIKLPSQCFLMHFKEIGTVAGFAGRIAV